MNRKLIYTACCAVMLQIHGTTQGQTLRLTQAGCREMALAHSEKIQQAYNTLCQAGLNRQIARSAFLPTLDASASGTYMAPDMEMTGNTKLQMRGMYMAGIDLTLPLYTGGKIRTGYRLSKIGEETASEQLRMARMDVLAEADNAYWTYIAVCRKVRMMQAYRRQMDSLYSQTRAAVEAGMATENDLLRIEAKRTDIHYQLQKTESGADLCRLSLCQVTGADFSTEFETADTAITVTAPKALTSDISGRPELNLLEKQVAAGREQIRMTWAEMLPTLALTGNYMYYGRTFMKGVADLGDGTTIPFKQEFKDGLWIAMLSLKVPLFHWGTNHKKVDKARLDLRNHELELQRNSRLLSIEARQAALNVQDGYRLIATAEKGLQQADENLRVMQARYAESLSPLTDLLDAQSQWQQAHSNLIEAQTQYKIYETQYLRSTGRLE